jgi:hypothetical protein
MGRGECVLDDFLQRMADAVLVFNQSAVTVERLDLLQ